VHSEYRTRSVDESFKEGKHTMDGFRKFLLRGNVVDLAVGVVIGVAFGAIVDGFIKAFIDPLLLLILSATGAATLETAMLGIFPVGIFISAVVRFIIVALVVYLAIVKPFAEISAKAAASTPPAPTPADIVLLTEIRDALKK
jgi:large conductance mechanosensitive channel